MNKILQNLFLIILVSLTLSGCGSDSNKKYEGQKEQTKNEMLCNVRNTFEKFNLISGLHSFMSDENKIYENVLPPVSILNEKDKLLLIEELNKLNFKLGSLKAA